MLIFEGERKEHGPYERSCHVNGPVTSTSVYEVEQNLSEV